MLGLKPTDHPQMGLNQLAAGGSAPNSPPDARMPILISYGRALAGGDCVFYRCAERRFFNWRHTFRGI